MPTAAEMAHSNTAPHVPSTPIENPRDAIKKPGLHRAITNPSHQRSAFSRCRSSTKASAIRRLRSPQVNGVSHGYLPGVHMHHACVIVALPFAFAWPEEGAHAVLVGPGTAALPPLSLFGQ